MAVAPVFTTELGGIDENVWEIPADGRADPGRIFADQELIDAIACDSLEQPQNVAALPGIVDATLAMPDMHKGYGSGRG